MPGDQVLQGENKGVGERSQSQAIPTIDLPKGGGAIRGIGEKFAANPVTGTGTMSVPIATSPGRGGFGPALGLSYDSGMGNGPFGFGWSLSLPSISRKTDKGLPRYLDAEDSDVFLLSGAEDLVPVQIEVAPGNWQPPTIEPYTEAGKTFLIKRYRPRIEGLFARIERWEDVDDAGSVHWRSISRDNILTLYGADANSRIADPADPARIFKWLICESRDDKGNAVVYQYKADDGAGINHTQVHERNRGRADDPRRQANRYLKTVLYGNRVTLLDGAAHRPAFLTDAQRLAAQWMFEVVFDYGEHDLGNPGTDEVSPWALRGDPFSSYRAGFELRTTRLCQRVLMFHHFAGLPNGESGYDGLVRSTDFTYSHELNPAHANNPVYTFLKAVTQSGYKLNGAGYLRRSLPPTEFIYSETKLGSQVESVPSADLQGLPVGLDGSSYQWVDLHGEGTPGILTEQAGAWHYKRNLSPAGGGEVALAPLERVASQPNMAMAGGQAQIMDLAGNGRPDLVVLDDPMPGFYPHDGEEGWDRFRPFESRLNRDTRDPNLRFIDLDGDGHADVLITEDEAFAWHSSLAESGFGPAQRVVQALDEEDGPRLVFADSTQSVFLADMSGDGLTDLVRVRNGDVCYWPNLGYARFGAKVTMGGSPHFDHPDQFDHQRLRLADIDGSGTTDLIYLHRDGVRLYFNQSGNGWSAPQALDIFPPIDALTNVTAVDLLGNGTACLVWSSALPANAGRQMRYVKLLDEQKPHLLIKTINNLGAETLVQYAPSTKFYLQDKRTGKPWITKLPFPVHVVEKTTVTDKWRGTSFSSTYSYHHGHFDGVEREFRGFGRVEQTDVESYGVFSEGNIDSPYITADHTLYQPPVKTVTWFHTGAAIDRERVLSQFEKEYFPNWLSEAHPGAPGSLGSFQEDRLPEPDLQAQNLDSAEWREALRACKGMVLRQETYELAVDDELHVTQIPIKLFSAANHNCHIRRLQPRGTHRHAVFLVTESEAVTYQYELDLRSPELTPDPRIAHTLNLRVDEFGNALQSVSVVYPRIGQHTDASLPPGAEALIERVQREMHLSYVETRYTNDVDEPANYRLRMPCEVLTYELTGFNPEDDSDRASLSDTDNRYFTLNELRRFRLSPVHQSSGEPVAELAYHLTAAPGAGPTKRSVQQVRMLYFNETLSDPLPFGQLNRMGLPFETYTLALTQPLLEAVFGGKLTGEAQLDLADASLSGYLSGSELAARFDDTAGQYWVRSGIAGFAPDAAAHFFLPERYTDPFGATTTLAFDELDLYIRSSTDVFENQTTVTRFDYRVLAPSEVRDINDNLSQVAFDILGMPVATAVKGKGSEGDSLDGFTADLLDPPLATRAGFFSGDFSEVEAQRLLGSATARHLIDLGEMEAADGTITYGHRPASAAGIVRERHAAQLAPGAHSPLQIGVEYSDGMGAVLVTKGLAEPEAPNGPLRWIASGKTILNNKGKPVKQYEPYVSESAHRFEEPRVVGVTPVIYYDAAGRVVRTELPDGSFSRVAFTPWFAASWDASDTALEPGHAWYAERTRPSASDEQRRAARQTAEHANTPAEVHLDSLGRSVISIEHNRVRDASGTLRDEKYLTHTRLDAEGKPLWIRDARGNLVMQYITPPVPNNQAADPGTDAVPCYDIAGNLLFQHSMDAGDRWLLSDASGQPFYAWDLNDRMPDDDAVPVLERRTYRTRYDALRRPLLQQLQINGEPWQTVERMVYGEGKPDPERCNLRGQLVQHDDPSSRITHVCFDFKGNPLELTRQLTRDHQAPVIDWAAATAPDAADLLVPGEVFTQRTEYDALNRMTRLYNWHRAGSRVAVYEPAYNQRGLLQSEELMVGADATRPDAARGLPYAAAVRTPAIRAITYDVKGQRESIEHGNETLTTYTYDEKSFRLIRLHTTGRGGRPALQDLRYTYDAVGNITDLQDVAQPTVFFANAVVEPHCRYQYDALYRLVSATGREHAVQNNGQPDGQRFVPELGIPFPNSPEALQNYTQTYRYDAVGNILSMAHSGGAVLRWKRCYQYAQDSNRLLATGKSADMPSPDAPCAPHYPSSPTLSQRYRYDQHGSMLNLDNTPVEDSLRWDHRDMIRSVKLGGGGDAWYSYDAGKQRTRKRIERNNGGNRVEERLYLGGMELYRRWLGGALVEEIETHHLFADDQRLLIVEDVLETDNNLLATGTLFRYQYSNHLDSAGLELDADGAAISYEEYHPYGTTAFQANGTEVRAVAKRYRYTGMERDEETGLRYHTARYYLPWLGRWGSSDPIGVRAGNNLYGYTNGNPINRVDKTGKQSESSFTDEELRNLPVSETVSFDDHNVTGSSDIETSDYALTVGPVRIIPDYALIIGPIRIFPQPVVVHFYSPEEISERRGEAAAAFDRIRGNGGWEAVLRDAQNDFSRSAERVTREVLAMKLDDLQNRIDVSENYRNILLTLANLATAGVARNFDNSVKTAEDVAMTAISAAAQNSMENASLSTTSLTGLKQSLARELSNYFESEVGHSSSPGSEEQRTRVENMARDFYIGRLALMGDSLEQARSNTNRYIHIEIMGSSDVHQSQEVIRSYLSDELDSRFGDLIDDLSGQQTWFESFSEGLVRGYQQGRGS